MNETSTKSFTCVLNGKAFLKSCLLYFKWNSCWHTICLFINCRSTHQITCWLRKIQIGERIRNEVLIVYSPISIYTLQCNYKNHPFTSCPTAEKHKCSINNILERPELFLVATNWDGTFVPEKALKIQVPLQRFPFLYGL